MKGFDLAKRLCIPLLVFLLGGCKNNTDTPDVSGIRAELSVKRFEKELFSLDSTRFNTELDKLQAANPNFGENFVFRILGADPKWSPDSVSGYVHGFVKAFKNVYDSSQAVFKDFTPYLNEIRQALRFLKYYFPDYKAPVKVITYIGPLDGFGDILTDDALIIGLHQHLGRNFSLYSSGLVQETYPGYLSSRFEPGYIVINCMKNIISDMYPEKMEDKPLVQQMVEKGKRLYVLSKLLPNKEEYQLIGYKKEQLKDAYSGERTIWDMFVKNNLLQNIDNSITKNYVSEGPKTQELGETSPGNIGSFAGWQIVKKYMQKDPAIKLTQLMNTDAETIFREARYKP